jgi:hypothetical protein
MELTDQERLSPSSLSDESALILTREKGFLAQIEQLAPRSERETMIRP